MSEKRYWMIRCKGDIKKSPEFCIENEVITYGWSGFDLSDFNSEVFNSIKNECSKGSSHPSMAKKFSSVNIGDVIVLPISGSVHIGEASSSCQYNSKWIDGDGANYIKVDWKIQYYPRADLSSSLQSSLKYKGTVLEFWKDNQISDLERVIKNPDYSINDIYGQKQEQINISMIDIIAEHINSNDNLNFKDNEFEEFIAELFELNFQGMNTEMISNQEEKKIGSDFIIKYDFGEKININIQFNVQVKQHEGNADLCGVDQINKSDSSDYNTKNILVTTGKLTEKIDEYAKENNVILYTNKEIAEMIVNNFDNIGQKYKSKLNLFKYFSPENKILG